MNQYSSYQREWHLQFVCLSFYGALMCKPAASHHAGGHGSCSCSCPCREPLQRIPVSQRGSTVETDHQATRRLLSSKFCTADRPLTRGWQRSGSRSEWATDGVNSEPKWSALLFAWAHAQAQAGSCQHFRNTSKMAIQRRD